MIFNVTITPIGREYVQTLDLFFFFNADYVTLCTVRMAQSVCFSVVDGMGQDCDLNFGWGPGGQYKVRKGLKRSGHPGRAERDSEMMRVRRG